jgi:hypothetical protein
MNKEEVRNIIIAQLGRHRDRNDLLTVLSRDLNIDWKQAEQLVRDVEASHRQVIARRQSPLLIILGLGVIIGGFALTTYGIWDFWIFSQLDTTEQFIHSESLYLSGGGMVTGLAMITGGIIGFRKIIGGIL